MSQNPSEFFRQTYAQLHSGLQPYPWQESLFLRIIADDWPSSITAPTGSGKTSLIAVWLAGLIWQADRGLITVPRRLVWVVNRRVVVDQATTEAEELRKRVRLGPELSASLSKLCLKDTGDGPLAISTLRGEYADNREWVRDPARAAIIIGTVDMIGSRLLFSGYGDSFRVRAHHAGLLGQDSLIVNDEAHLTPAFAKLLSELAPKAGRIKPVRTIRLSATLSGSEPFPVSFEPDLAASETFAKRFRAAKLLALHEVKNAQDAMRQCVSLATGNPATRTILFVNTPKEAAELASLLRKKAGERVRVLTGTQRGHYRDRLTNEDPVFQAFQQPQEPAEPCWLVATSAGEVGINITCSRLITLLATADRLLQRFGRLNRFGETSGEAHLVYVPPKEKQARETATLAYLSGLPPVSEDPEKRDISPAAVLQHPPPAEAVEEQPALAVLHDWIVDRWTLTSIVDSSAKKKVEPWLHGKAENLPRTVVVWREETALLTRAGVDLAGAAKALRLHRIVARERLEEPTYQLIEKLKTTQFAPGLLLTASGKILPMRESWPSEEELAYATLILRPGCGGLENGMFHPEGEKAPDVADLAGQDHDLRRARFVISRQDDQWSIGQFGGAEAQPIEDVSAAGIRRFLKTRGMVLAHLVEGPIADEGADEPEFLLIYARGARQQSPQEKILLSDHQRDVAGIAQDLAKSIQLGPSLTGAYHWAGLNHDMGKRHRLWREAMNCAGGEPLAKTDSRRTRPKLLGGLRHELVSLVDGAQNLSGCPADEQDLALHLIACHHGWARPHFKDNAGDPDRHALSAQLAYEATLRFARLQSRYGPWGLAYLEALFRAADWLASEGVVPVPEEPDDE